MNFEFNQCNTRRTGVVMLFLWMMSLMLGFANGCVLVNDYRSPRHAFVASAHTLEFERDLSHGGHFHDDSGALG